MGKPVSGKVTLVIISVFLVLLMSGTGCSVATTSSPVATVPKTTAVAPPSTSKILSSPSPSAVTKPKEIRIGIMGGQTGPAPASVVALIKETEYMFKYINDVEGGIDGVKLSWRVVDNKGTPEGAVLAYKELRDNFKPLIYLAVEDYYLLGVKDQIKEDKAVIVTFSTIQPQAFAPPDRFFSIAIATSDGFGGYVRWVLQQKNSTKPKIGVITWDLASGQMWRQSQAWATKQGVDIEAVQFPMATLDFKPQLLKLRDAGVTHIWAQVLGSQAAMFIRDYKSLAMTTPVTFMEYMESNQLLDLVKEGADGFYLYRSETPFSDNSEAAKLFDKIYQFNEGKGKQSDNRLALTAKLVIQAGIKQAVADVGWDKIDSSAVYSALNKLTQIDTLGNSPGFGYGPDKRVGVTSIKIAQFRGGQVVSISEPITLPRTFEGIDK